MVDHSASRRGFLRGLTALPLIGGGVTLIGSPIAVAEPLSEQLLDSYDAWLEYERRNLQWERARGSEMRHRLHMPFVMQMYGKDGRPKGKALPCDYVPCANAGAGWHHNGEAPPSTRAALVLSAVGCDWREGGL
ncbi:hypothetical protein [Methylobacterium platani]|uniref:Uncharacterized protein n=2 Tax=Methylobacterium platani TaxID=427683 RepID=A0A179S1F8_9HYPH|nr:hypothetical protein [Methylobacterium platani]KMO13352.1 hypothetical protein SQ03_22115 [Methylobacterium platani JCM 14648]OAS16651.1 hypothetical protein A5481_28230 [Methylobacterium platani]